MLLSLLLSGLLLSGLLLSACYSTAGLFGDDDRGAGDDDTAASDDDDAGDDDAGDDVAGDDDAGDDDAVTDSDGDGFASDQDCDDEDPAAYPGATELCDGIDNNCDNQVDEGLLVTLYQDFDGDGWGTESTAQSLCPDETGSDWVAQAGDCNDNHTLINPGTSEVCDSLDNDCNGTADDGDVCPCQVEYYPDVMHPYMFCTETATWYQAAAACSASEYRLVTFDSQAELTWATDQAIGIATSNRWWLGFNDEASEGDWVWEDSSVVGFQNWCSDEPNNGHGSECSPTSNEDCAMLNWGAGGCWNDYPCECDWMYYICEGNSELRPQNLD